MGFPVFHSINGVTPFKGGVWTCPLPRCRPYFVTSKKNNIMGVPKGISFTYGEVDKAYNDCLRNKRNTANAIAYTIDAARNNIRLANEINDGTYRIGKSIAFCVTSPKAREVFAADFRDRIVHHLVVNELTSLFDRLFINDSYSCRKGKGVLYGTRRVYGMVKECSMGYTRDAWILKMDLKAFFMSIDKSILAERLDDFISKEYPENRKKGALRRLCRQIILHHPELDCERRGNLGLWDTLPKEKSLFSADGNLGLPIGNLTSQVFANFFLDPLDKYVTRELGLKYYGRYVDDIVIICEDKERLLSSIRPIMEFADKTLHVTVNPRKIYFQHYRNGVLFIGTMLKRGRTYIGNRTKGNLHYKLSRYFGEVDAVKAGSLARVVNSYLGFMVHHDSYRIRKGFFKEGGTLDRWKGCVTPGNGYKKIAVSLENRSETTKKPATIENGIK